MYWDTLTVAGFFVSIVLTVGAFYLALRERPAVRRNDFREI
jgi:heme/copper-type cytochrome/quinol oxidase subunit 4